MHDMEAQRITEYKVRQILSLCQINQNIEYNAERHGSLS